MPAISDFLYLPALPLICKSDRALINLKTAVALHLNFFIVQIHHNLKERKMQSDKSYHLGLHESLKVLVRHLDQFPVGAGIEKDLFILRQMLVHIDLHSV